MNTPEENVIRQWIVGFPRDTIAVENNIGAGTVCSIVANYKYATFGNSAQQAKSKKGKQFDRVCRGETRLTLKS
jgi:hypothetical protein